MLGRSYLNVNEKGHLTFEGCDTAELAADYGTPLYVVSENEIRRRCSRLKECFIGKYDNVKVLYASKAFSNISIYKIIKDEGLGLDVVSGGELYTAIKAGFPMEKVYFHGNNKTIDEITLGIDNNIGCFVIDNSYEMSLVQSIAEEKGKKVNALLRISPGISGHTHEYISTGQLDSKFGFPIQGGAAIEAVSEILGYPNIHFKGVHCHIGSQIYNMEAYKETASIMMGLIKEITDKLGIEVEELNLGGGFGVYDLDSDKLIDAAQFTDIMMETVEEKSGELNIKRPAVLVEPGRWMVSEAGITLYTLGAIKDIRGIRKYVSVDGGMADNPRPALYQAQYQAVVANKAGEECSETVTIAGKCCESGDMLIRDLRTPEIKSGDILAVFGTGAYNYSMASNYNRLRKPAVIMIRDGQPRIIIKRETYEDLVSCDVDE